MTTHETLLSLTGALVQDVLQDHRKLKQVFALLYDMDMEKRFCAAKALGELAERSPDLIAQKWRRIYDACDDTMSCWGVAEALGEIARALPEVRGRIVMRLGKFHKDECTCQGYLWALGRIGRVDRESIRDRIPHLESALFSENACIIGQALWAVGELELGETAERVRELTGDNRETWLYENDAVGVKTVGAIAAEALEKMERRRAAGAH